MGTRTASRTESRGQEPATRESKPVQGPGAQGRRSRPPADRPATEGPAATSPAVSVRLNCALDGRGRAQRRYLPAVAHGRPRRHHDQQRHQCSRQGSRDIAASSGGQGVGEQARLGQDQPGPGQSEGDGNHQVTAGAAGITQQPRINRPAAPAIHQDSPARRSQAYSAVFGGFRAAWTGSLGTLSCACGAAGVVPVSVSGVAAACLPVAGSSAALLVSGPRGSV